MSDLNQFFQHKNCVYGFARQNIESLEIIRFHHVGIPELSASQHCIIQIAEVVSRWSQLRQPLIFQATDHDCLSACIGFPVGHHAVHGVGCVHEGVASFFWFDGIDVQINEQISQVLEILVPHMHAALNRVWVDADNNQVVSATESGSAKPEVILSVREREVLQWLAAGKTNPEIALILDIGAETVKTYVGRVFVKLGVSSRAQATAKAKMFSRLT